MVAGFPQTDRGPPCGVLKQIHTHLKLCFAASREALNLVSQCNGLFHLDWIPDAAGGLLDVEHGGDGGGYVCHVRWSRSPPGRDVPSHKDEGDVCVVVAPYAMLRAGRCVGIVIVVTRF